MYILIHIKKLINNKLLYPKMIFCQIYSLDIYNENVLIYLKNEVDSFWDKLFANFDNPIIFIDDLSLQSLKSDTLLNLRIFFNL